MVQGSVTAVEFFFLVHTKRLQLIMCLLCGLYIYIWGQKMQYSKFNGIVVAIHSWLLVSRLENPILTPCSAPANRHVNRKLKWKGKPSPKTKPGQIQMCHAELYRYSLDANWHIKTSAFFFLVCLKENAEEKEPCFFFYPETNLKWPFL